MSIRYNLSMPIHSITYQSCICNSQPHVNTYISNKIICKTTNIMHNEIFNQVHASTFHIINTYEIHNNIHIFPIICSQRTYCKQFLIPRIQHTYMPSTQTRITENNQQTCYNSVKRQKQSDALTLASFRQQHTLKQHNALPKTSSATINTLFSNQ